MLRNWIFWVVMAGMVVVCFLIFGCEDTGKIPTRFAETLVGGGDGISRAWLCYRDYDGYLIEQEGVRVDRVREHSIITYITSPFNDQESFPTDTTRIDGGILTGGGGRLELYGARIWTPLNGNLHTASATYQSPRDSFDSVSVRYYTRATVASQSMLPSGNTVPQHIPPAADELSNLTTSEFAAISGTGYPLPSSGISYTCSLVQQCGENGGGYTKNVGGLVPFSMYEPENVLRYASPMMYSYIVKTAEPENLLGESFSAKVKTDAMPEGVPVEVTIVAENEEQTVHIARTEYFLPVDIESYEVLATEEITTYDRWTPLDDPNDLSNFMAYYDPNTTDPNNIDPNDMENPENFRYVSHLDTSDPNFIIDGIMQEERVMPCQVIPIGDDDELSIEFVPDERVYLKAIKSWLTDSKVFDINNDGVVNFNDWCF